MELLNVPKFRTKCVPLPVLLNAAVTDCVHSRSCFTGQSLLFLNDSAAHRESGVLSFKLMLAFWAMLPPRFHIQHPRLSSRPPRTATTWPACWRGWARSRTSSCCATAARHVWLVHGPVVAALSTEGSERAVPVCAGAQRCAVPAGGCISVERNQE